MNLPSSDRRDFPRRPCLVRFTLPWRGREEKCFATDVSRCGAFLRTSVIPPIGTIVSLVFPGEEAIDERVRLKAKVVRQVRRGNASQPLGGVGLQLLSLTSPLGARPAYRVLRALLATDIPRIHVSGNRSLSLEFPSLLPSSAVEPVSPSAVEIDIADAPVERTRAVKAHHAVFLKCNNLIIRGQLRRLGSTQAILTELQVLPEIGETLSVRLLATGERFKGLQFEGRVDQIEPGRRPRNSVVSLAIDPASDGSKLRAFIHMLRQENDGISTDC